VMDDGGECVVELSQHPPRALHLLPSMTTENRPGSMRNVL
jgi:hypothetical protein